MLGLALGLQTGEMEALGETESVEGCAVVVVNKREAALVVRPSLKPRIKHSAVAPPWENPATRTREGGMPWWMHVEAMRARRAVQVFRRPGRSSLLSGRR